MKTKTHALSVHSLILLVATTSIVPNAAGQELPRTTEAPVVYSNTLVVAAIDTSRITLPDSLLRSENLPVASFADMLGRFAEQLDEMAAGKTSYVALDIPAGPRSPVARYVLNNKNEAAIWQRKIPGVLRAEANDCVVLTFEEHAPFAPGIEIEDDQVERFRAAEAVVKGYPIRILIVPPRYFMETLEQGLPALPKRFGGMSTEVLTQGVRWAAIGFDPQQFRLTATVQSQSAEAAQAFSKALIPLLTDAVKLLPKSQQSWLTPITQEIVQRMQLSVHDSQIRVTFPSLNAESAETLIASIAGSAVTSAKSILQNKSVRDKLRAIQLGILNYESANACFPPRAKYRDENGKPKLSWRVHILPYMGEAELYEQFHLDESWDSPHNITLLPRMPEIYKAPSSWVQRLNQQVDERADQVIPTHTTFLAPIGEGTVFGQDAVAQFRDILDGTSKTVSVVNVRPGLAKPWTAPQDYAFEKDSPAAGLAFDATGVSACVAFDGAVHSLKKAWKAERFLRLFQCDDAQPVDFED